MKKSIFIILIAILFSSCATIFNDLTKKVKIHTNEPTKLIVGTDSIEENATEHIVHVARSKKPLVISAFSNNKNKKVSIKSKNSFAFYLNAYPYFFGLSFIIDYKLPYRHTYPKNIYIDLNDNKTNYLDYKPLDSIIRNKKNIVKLTPLKVFTLGNAGYEISYERKFNNSFATQISAAYLYRSYNVLTEYSLIPDTKGFELGIEEKWYFKKSAPIMKYISLNFNYLQNEHQTTVYLTNELEYSNELYRSYKDTINVAKKTYSLNLKYGYQVIKKRISIDMYFGIGIRYKDVQHFDKIYPNDKISPPRHPSIGYISIVEGKYFIVSIPFNIRLGWFF